MQTLSDNVLDQCPVENGFRLRGQGMTRIEVFIDAAFAFAVTLLVISFDRIPASFDEIVVAIKTIPAFAVAVVQLVWIWHTHSQWSERYGLRDTRTVVYSTAILIVMLIYIYPMRIMFESFFSWISNGYFPTSFRLQSIDELVSMFVFLGTGLLVLCLIFSAMYRHAGANSDALRLNGFEKFQTTTSSIRWLGSAIVCLVPISLALTLPPQWVPFSGFAFVLFAVWIPAVHHYRERRRATSN
jgi:hypothetical protein